MRDGAGDVIERWIRRAAALALMNAALSAAAWAQATPITIDSSTTIVESTSEAGSVARATQDLLGDFTKVFGRAPGS